MSASPCIHCQALALEVQELRAALGLSGRLTEQRAIERRFKLTRAQAKIVQALYDAGGRVVPRATLDAVALRDAAEGGDSLKTHICRIRALIGADVIDTAEGGYAMTPVGRALVYSALCIRGEAA